jgi:hypothetical protein
VTKYVRELISSTSASITQVPTEYGT